MNVASRIARLETQAADEQQAQRFLGLAYQPNPDDDDRFEVTENGRTKVLTGDELRRLNPQKIIVGVSADSLRGEARTDNGRDTVPPGAKVLVGVDPNSL